MFRAEHALVQDVNKAAIATRKAVVAISDKIAAHQAQEAEDIGVMLQEMSIRDNESNE